MCGIVGAVYPDSGAVNQAMVRRMCSLITRRGPDDDGFYFADQVGLGMRRLSIIDVHAGKQPIHNEDKTVWVVFNGEIYNYRELRQDLAKRGHRLVTSSDTECLVHLYEDLGDDFVSQLRGMFAFAIWDDGQKKLLLGRDRLGIKPCYYWQHGEALCFGSELKCLLAADGFQRRINLCALSDYLTFKYVPGPQTIYEGIREIPPAHIGVWSKGTFQLRRYWQLKPTPADNRSVEYYAEGLLHHLEEAVHLHLVSEVPLGAFLSGGIDSSAIVALMAKVGPGRVKTFTIGFDAGQVGVDERAVRQDDCRPIRDRSFGISLRGSPSTGRGDAVTLLDKVVEFAASIPARIMFLSPSPHEVRGHNRRSCLCSAAMKYFNGRVADASALPVVDDIPAFLGGGNVDARDAGRSPQRTKNTTAKGFPNIPTSNKVIEQISTADSSYPLSISARFLWNVTGGPVS
jgi:Glutamine amidotransferase domain/Asparagine synthase